MFSDPQSVTISGTANSLARTGTGLDSGVFQKDDGNVKMSVQHAYNKRTRRTIRLDHRKVAADPLLTAQNANYNLGIYVVVDAPPLGYTPAEVKAVWDGFIANLAASSAANTIKFLGGES